MNSFCNFVGFLFGFFVSSVCTIEDSIPRRIHHIDNQIFLNTNFRHLTSDQFIQMNCKTYIPVSGTPVKANALCGSCSKKRYGLHAEL